MLLGPTTSGEVDMAKVLFSRLESIFVSSTHYKQNEIRNQVSSPKNYPDKMCMEIPDPPKDWRYGYCQNMNLSNGTGVWFLQRTVTFKNGRKYTMKINDDGSAQFYDGNGKLLLGDITYDREENGLTIRRDYDTEKMWEKLKYFSLFEKGLKMMLSGDFDVPIKVFWSSSCSAYGGCSSTYFSIEKARKANAEAEVETDA